MEKGADDSESEPDHDRIAEAQKGAAEAASDCRQSPGKSWDFLHL